MIISGMWLFRFQPAGQNNQIYMPIDPTNTTKYILKYVEGLGVPDSDIFIADTVEEGGIYQGSRVQSREIVVRILLNPDYSIGETPDDLRNKLYMYVTSSLQQKKITLQFDIADLSIGIRSVGYLKRFETALFQSEPEVQLTFVCPNPLLYEATPEILTDLTGPFPLVLPYIGNAAAGIEATFTFLVDWDTVASSFRFGIQGSTMNFIGEELLTGDVLKVNTNVGSRRITRTRGGVEQDAAWLMTYVNSDSSMWTFIDPSCNVTYQKMTVTDFDPLKVQFNELKFTNSWWGV